MIDFTTLQGLTIPEGVVTEITDAQGRVLWMLPVAGGPVILEVEKITSDTYAGSTTYTGESFVLLNIYPATNGTVNVTYGGLTKTITDTSGVASPNAQQVFFGTFNGVADSVETPASGTLTIEGDYRNVTVGTYESGSKAGSTKYCSCVTAITNLGSVNTVEANAFRGCTRLTSVVIPNGATWINMNAFYGCTGLTSVTIPNSVGSIAAYAFQNCSSLTSVTIPNSVTGIGISAFQACSSLASVVLPNKLDRINSGVFNSCTSLASVTIPSGVMLIDSMAFYQCDSLTSVTIPSGVTTINDYAFGSCDSLTSVIFENKSGWYVTETSGETSGTAVDVADPENNAALVRDTYAAYYWRRSQEAS